MATLHGGPHGAVLYVKGSSDALLERCSERLEADGGTGPCDAAALHREVDAMAARGLRVLVVARRSLPLGTRCVDHGDIEQLTFLGLVGMIDPPRAGAKRAVAACQGAGIKVKMITGDHAVTAAAIADELGLRGARVEDGRLRSVTGEELATVTDVDLPTLADDVAVFARVAPEQTPSEKHDPAKPVATREELEALLLAGLASGEPQPVMEDDWQRLRQRALAGTELRDSGWRVRRVQDLTATARGTLRTSAPVESSIGSA